MFNQKFMIQHSKGLSDTSGSDGRDKFVSISGDFLKPQNKDSNAPLNNQSVFLHSSVNRMVSVACSVGGGGGG